MSKLLSPEEEDRLEREMNNLKLPPAERAWMRQLLSAMEACVVKGDHVSVDLATSKIETKLVS